VGSKRRGRRALWILQVLYAGRDVNTYDPEIGSDALEMRYLELGIARPHWKRILSLLQVRNFCFRFADSRLRVFKRTR
jgi:hypothetical protein